MFSPIHPRYQTTKRRPTLTKDEKRTHMTAAHALTSMYDRIDEDLAEL